MFQSLNDGARALALYALGPFGGGAKAEWLAQRIAQGVKDDLDDLEAQGRIARVAGTVPCERRTPLSEPEIDAAIAAIDPLPTIQGTLTVDLSAVRPDAGEDDTAPLKAVP